MSDSIGGIFREEPQVPRAHFKCNFCHVCLGKGCVGQLPGMGGVNNSHNFIVNCEDWKAIYKEFSKNQETKKKIDSIKVTPENIGIGPVTGAIQNIGFDEEKDFYLPYMWSAAKTGISICVGDGCPDEKLALGIQACKSIGEKAYFFFKPYPDPIIEKRIELSKPYALAMGMDIDAYNIITMRNQVNLEQKTVDQLEWFRKKSGLPLAIKGVFTEKDVELCEKAHPEIIVVSNHGGRVDTDEGSSARFLQKNAARLSACCNELWVDGGIRSKKDIQTALYLGAKKVLIARSFISCLCKNGVNGMISNIQSMM